MMQSTTHGRRRQFRVALTLPSRCRRSVSSSEIDLQTNPGLMTTEVFHCVAPPWVVGSRTETEVTSGFTPDHRS